LVYVAPFWETFWLCNHSSFWCEKKPLRISVGIRHLENSRWNIHSTEKRKKRDRMMRCQVLRSKISLTKDLEEVWTAMVRPLFRSRLDHYSSRTRWEAGGHGVDQNATQIFCDMKIFFKFFVTPRFAVSSSRTHVLVEISCPPSVKLAPKSGQIDQWVWCTSLIISRL
jgi:hypothetical protein